ncbi:hypothetical protein GCM10009560_00430 [Nonomuraea longicatena]|uniref:Uncharacterized protein n=2 Tax=Nonomuraea longicatena TaxID=83682 RepID=A0ABN1NM13_9ACTN
MRDVYRGIVVALAVAAVAAGIFLVYPSGPDEVAARPVAAPSAVPATSSEPAPSASPAATVPAAVPATPSPTATPTIAPGYTAMEALAADRRLPKLTRKVKRTSLPAPAKRVHRDKRAGVAVPRLGKPWKTFGAAPFTSKQVLPKPRGRAQRGLLVTCPLPIEEQRSARDTALLAARWSLNHHPEGAKVRWLASQRVKGGWALMYRVVYGKRQSVAAVVVVDRKGMDRPALAFVSVPDTHRRQWRDVKRVISGIRVLG